MHGLQAWVALPEASEETEPAFAHHAAAALPTFDGPGVRARLIAGTAFGKTAPARVHSPLFYLHLDLTGGASAEAPEDYPERALYVVSGAVEAAGKRLEAGEMGVLAPKTAGGFAALEPSVVAVLGGEPVGPRHIWWNFVSSSADRIAQAKADWRAGRISLPPTDRDEVIPLPED